MHQQSGRFFSFARTALLAAGAPAIALVFAISIYLNVEFLRKFAKTPVEAIIFTLIAISITLMKAAIPIAWTELLRSGHRAWASAAGLISLFAISWSMTASVSYFSDSPAFAISWKPVAAIAVFGFAVVIEIFSSIGPAVIIGGALAITRAQLKIEDHAPKPQALAMPPAIWRPSGAMRVITANQVSPVNIDWLWRHMIPRGHLTLIAGFGSAGKTTMCLGLAAIVSRGGYWPDGSQAPIGRSIVIEGEDPLDAVTVPRLIAAGANLSLISLADPGHEPVTSDYLDKTARNIDNLQMVVMSPIRRLIHDNQANNMEIRRRLEPLIEWAKLRNCALIGIMHPQKGNQRQTADALAGSAAYTELARAVHMASIDYDDTEPNDLLKRRVLMSVKVNVAPSGIRHHYMIESADALGIETSRVVWLGSGGDGRPQAAMGAHAPRTQAMTWLANVLQGGPKRAEEIEELAARADIARATLYRAANAINVFRETDGEGRKIWSLNT